METNRTPGVTFMSNRRVDDCPKTPVPAPAREYGYPLDRINEASAAQAGKSEIIFDPPMGCEIATTDKAGGSVGKDSSSQTSSSDLWAIIRAVTSNSMPLNLHQCRYLSSKLERKDVSAEDLREAFPSVLKAADIMTVLCSLHHLDIAHCDLKSDNVLIQSEYTSPHLKFQMVKVADFGIPKESMPYMFESPHIGTTFWRAPEIFVDRHKPDVYNPSVLTVLKSDVYSYGMVCIEILAGREPFQDVTKVHRSGRSEYETAVEAKIEVSKSHWSEYETAVEAKIEVSKSHWSLYETAVEAEIEVSKSHWSEYETAVEAEIEVSKSHWSEYETAVEAKIEVSKSHWSEYETAVEAEIEVSKFHWSELAEVRHEKLRHGLLKKDGTLSNGRQEESPVSNADIDSKEERPFNVPSVNLAHSRKWRRKHFRLRDETLSKAIQMLRPTVEELAACFFITDDKSADSHKFFTDVPLEEITAESSSCLETNSSRSRKSNRATAKVDDLLSTLAPLVKQQIEDALSARLLPLVAVLRSREENEQKHREQMLALEEQKLALKRQKLALERQNLLLELRRGVKHSRSSHLSGRRQGLKKPRY